MKISRFIPPFSLSLFYCAFRPDWEKCGKYVEGGAERWKELSQDQSSCALVDTLLAEMTGQPLAMIKSGVGAAREFFKGLVSASTPVEFLDKI